MAILKSGSTVGGNLILHQGMLPLYPKGDSLFMKNYKVYTEFDKPNNSDVGLGNVTNDAQVKKAGDTMTGDLFIKTAGFRVIDDTLFLSTEKKSIHFRPQGKDNTIGQVIIDINGAVTGTSFLSSGPQSSLANANTRKDYVDQQDQNIINTTPRLDKLDELVNGIIDRRRKKMILHELVIGTDTQLESQGTLGNNSLTLGDSDTGLKWVKDGHMQLWSNYVAVADIDQSLMYFNRPVHYRMRNYNGSENEAIPVGSAFLTMETDRDGSAGWSMLGYNDNASGEMHHYLRGKGQTHIDTQKGLYVVGRTYVANTIEHLKPYGAYDQYSMPNWKSDKTVNHLRILRADGLSTWFHELCVNGTHPEVRARSSISWFQGDTPTYWMASLDHFGELKLAKGLSTWGGGNTIQINSVSASSGYIAGNLDGRMNAWVLGKTDANSNLVLQNNMYNDGAKNTAFILGDAQLHTTVGGNSILKAYNNRLEVDGARWAATNDHAWASQWNQRSPICVNFGSVPGTSDYYPILEGIGSATGVYNTSFQFGMIREGNDRYGRGVLRVGDYNYEPAKSKMGIFYFDIDGKFTTNHVMALDKILVGGGAYPGLPGPSITLGDNDTGLKWLSDGLLSAWANNAQVFRWDSNAIITELGKSIQCYGDLNQANDSYSTYVRDIYIRSDIRVKSQLREFDSPSETSKKIQGYLYLQKKGLKQDGSINWEQSAGLIAQEVQEVLPELITVDKDSEEKLLRLNYNGIIALNTATINEHTDQIRSLQDEIKELKQLISKLI